MECQTARFHGMQHDDEDVKCLLLCPFFYFDKQALIKYPVSAINGIMIEIQQEICLPHLPRHPFHLQKMAKNLNYSLEFWSFWWFLFYYYAFLDWKSEFYAKFDMVFICVAMATATHLNKKPTHKIHSVKNNILTHWILLVWTSIWSLGEIDRLTIGF